MYSFSLVKINNSATVVKSKATNNQKQQKNRVLKMKKFREVLQTLYLKYYSHYKLNKIYNIRYRGHGA